MSATLYIFKKHNVPVEINYNYNMPGYTEQITKNV